MAATTEKQTSFIPYLIIGALALFIIYIASFIVRSHDYQVNLVSKDYYKKEIEYQNQINIEAVSQKLIKDFSTELTDTKIIIQIPVQIASPEGTVQLYRPSDSKMDKVLPIVVNTSNQVVLDKSKITTGLWHVQVKCKSKTTGQAYYFNSEINL